MSKKAIIIGATSGIGNELARELHRRGHSVGLTGRRTHLLEQLKSELGSRAHIQPMDVTDLAEAKNRLESLIRDMGGMDIIVLNAGVSDFQGEITWEKERQVIDVNVMGFASLASFAFDYFERQGSGQIVGISSVAALFGYGLATAYNASKAFASTFMQGYRQRANHSDADITITDIKPGFVKSEMTENLRGMFWVVETEKAARQIADDIIRKRNHSYVSRKWRLVGWLVKATPNWVWDRI